MSFPSDTKNSQYTWVTMAVNIPGVGMSIVELVFYNKPHSATPPYLGWIWWFRDDTLSVDHFPRRFFFAFCRSKPFFSPILSVTCRTVPFTDYGILVPRLLCRIGMPRAGQYSVPFASSSGRPVATGHAPQSIREDMPRRGRRHCRLGRTVACILAYRRPTSR